MNQKSVVARYYANRLRLRVCGICTEGQGLLLVLHKGLGSQGELWIPPGGEVELGQSIKENLEREFLEETGLQVKAEELLFVHEYLQEPLHAVELFFKVSLKGGKLRSGYDPELSAEEQIIKEVGFFHYSQIKSFGKERVHAMLGKHNSLKELINCRGYFKFEK